MMAIGKIVSLAVAGPSRLELEWDDGHGAPVDLGEVIAGHPGLKAIRAAPAFAKAALSDDGWSVEWPGGVDFGSPQLRRWADEQAGELMRPGDFRSWMEMHALTLDRAAQALGLSRRMVAYYASGEKPIPKTVLLATVGYGARVDGGPVFTPMLEVVRSTDRSHDLDAVENRLTAIEYGLAAVHHMLRSRANPLAQPAKAPAGAPYLMGQREPQAELERIERDADPINAFRRADDEANLLSQPAFGPPDDLEAIEGIGPMLRALLSDIGVFYFWQVAEWTEREIDWVESKLLHFRERIRRDDWVGHARILAQATTAAKRPNQLRAKRAGGL